MIVGASWKQTRQQPRARKTSWIWRGAQRRAAPEAVQQASLEREAGAIRDTDRLDPLGRRGGAVGPRVFRQSRQYPWSRRAALRRYSLRLARVRRASRCGLHRSEVCQLRLELFSSACTCSWRTRSRVRPSSRPTVSRVCARPEGRSDARRSAAPVPAAFRACAAPSAGEATAPPPRRGQRQPDRQGSRRARYRRPGRPPD